jgi:hypothetical protein
MRCVTFCNMLFFFLFLQWRVVSPLHNPLAGRPPLVGSLRRLIQYIRSYTNYMEAVSSVRKQRT